VLIGLNLGGDSSRSLGDLLGVTTAFFYAAYMFAITRARRDTDALTLMTISTSVTAIALLPIALVLSEVQSSTFVPDGAHGWLVLVGLALVAQVAGQTLIAYAAARLPVALSSTTLLIQPLVAALAAWLLFTERLSPLQIGGGVVLVVGLWLARRGSAAPTSPPLQSRTESL
jgi:drug/metabolite transporter (DMT)-like permease